MSTKNAGAFSSTDVEAQAEDSDSFLIGVISSLHQALESEQERSERLEGTVEQLRDDNEELRERIEELETRADIHETRLDAQDDAIEALEQDRDVHESRLNAQNDAIERVEDESSDANPGGDADGSPSQAPHTPIERLLDDPQNSGIRITSSVKRSMRIVANFKEWSEKTSSGRVVNRNLRRLLEGVGGEQLYWKQVHRAGEKVEQLTNGAIEFIKTDHNGWVLRINNENDGFLARVVSVGGGG